MPLSSPRFLGKSELTEVFSNFSTLRVGKRGSEVQIVQQALIDLGFDCSPSDGIYGIITETAVKAFQNRKRLSPDGIVGSKTLSEIDHLLPGYEHRVRIHFRSINLTSVPFGQILNKTNLIYAQYGIQIEMASGQSLLLSPEQTQKYFSIQTGCDWTISSGEAFDLQGLGGAVPSNEILVYYVNRFDDVNLLGCGGHAKDRPAATVASNASQWDTAHEIGHVLLTSSFSPVHSPKTTNLMYAWSGSSDITPTLDDQQLAQMRRSNCCVAI